MNTRAQTYLDNTAMNRAMVRFMGARENAPWYFWNAWDLARRHDGRPLWRETLGRSLGSHDAAGLVGGMCYSVGCQQETARPHAISCTKTGYGALSSTIECFTRHWLISFAESKVQVVIEDLWPFRERASGINGRLNPALQMGITTDAGHSSTSTPDARKR